MENDVRLLTLFKQHYMDDFKEPLNCEYSCWGYYDGIDVVPVGAQPDSGISHGRNDGEMSRLWYESGKKTQQITGNYSIQNIGLIRCVDYDDNLKKFWKENDVLLFFGVAFLQLHQPMEALKFGKDIEKRMNLRSETEDSDIRCRVISYITFDNADLVLLIHSNSLSKMEEDLRSIEKDAEVRYLHSIIGVSEKYLRACYKAQQIIADWNGIPCCINENVKRVDIRIASSGEDEIVEIQNSILSSINREYGIRNFEHAKYSFVSGHENVVISIDDTDVRTLLIFLLPEGFATHQNKSYSKRRTNDGKGELPRIYNIETSYVLQEEYLKDAAKAKGQCLQENASGMHHEWFKEQIKKLKENLSKVRQWGDDGLYAYVLALLKTMNTLVQYENFGLADNLFYLLYPSFAMFEKKFLEAMERFDENNWQENYNELSMVKQSVREYVESVNSVIYHTIHTDQVFLMIPGYSGTSFSIPIKMNMFFWWFTDCVAQIFGKPDRKYRCIIFPDMESRPETKRIQFQREEEDFLVCVRISQRTLAMPQYLMIILAHEMGHYIGGERRFREKRKNLLIRYAAEYMAEKIFAKENPTLEQGKIIKALKDEFQNEVETYIQNCFAAEGTLGYYSEEVEAIIHGACLNILAENHFINEDMIEILMKQGEDIPFEESAVETLINLEKSARDRARILLQEDAIYDAVKNEMKIYREAFSDIIAIELLECEEKDFRWAFQVSEGNLELAEQTKRRLNVMRKLGKKGWEKFDDEQSDADVLLAEYVKSCHDNPLIDPAADQGRLEAIRSLYLLFKGKSEMSEIYREVVKCIDNMKKDINNELICLEK